MSGFTKVTSKSTISVLNVTKTVYSPSISILGMMMHSRRCSFHKELAVYRRGQIHVLCSQRQLILFGTTASNNPWFLHITVFHIHHLHFSHTSYKSKRKLVFLIFAINLLY